MLTKAVLFKMGTRHQNYYQKDLTLCTFYNFVNVR
jgi:hypothetical protein